MMLFHSALFLTSIFFASTSFLSSFTTSRNLFFGLPSCLFSGNSIAITLLPSHSCYLLMKCPYHFSLPSLIFIFNRFTLIIPLMYSFLILSFLVTPIANLNILTLATSISSTCIFVTVIVSNLYTIVGLTTKLYTFPFIPARNLMSEIAPDRSYFSPSVSSCLPLTTTIFCTFDSKYLNSFTLSTFVSSIFTVSLSFSPFTHRYSVFDQLT